jgi:hypothetical protein
MRRSALLGLAGVLAVLVSSRVGLAAGNEPYASGRIIVAFRDGTHPLRDPLVLSPAEAQTVRDDASRHQTSSNVPAYTNDDATNHALALAGAYRLERLYKTALPSASPAPSGINLSNAYVVYIGGVPVREAVATLRKLSTVAYASADWRVDTMNQ